MTKQEETDFSKAVGLLNEARELIANALPDREYYFEEKSDGWQESDEGCEYEDRTSQLEQATGDLELIADLLEEE